MTETRTPTHCQMTLYQDSGRSRYHGESTKPMICLLLNSDGLLCVKSTDQTMNLTLTVVVVK